MRTISMHRTGSTMYRAWGRIIKGKNGRGWRWGVFNKLGFATTFQKRENLPSKGEKLSFQK